MKKDELYALLTGVKEQGLTLQSGLKAVVLPAYEKLVEKHGGWEVVCHVLYDCPPLQEAEQPLALESAAEVTAPAVPGPEQIESSVT